MNKGVLVHIE